LEQFFSLIIHNIHKGCHYKSTILAQYDNIEMTTRCKVGAIISKT